MSRPKIYLSFFSLLAGCILMVPAMVNGQARLVPPDNYEVLPAPPQLRQRQNIRQRQGQRNHFRRQHSHRVTSNVVAIQSFNYPSRFLRHSHFSAVLHKSDHSALFARDSSFVMRAGLAGRGVSFESVNYPGYFLRHSGHALRLHKDDGRAQFARDATFRIVDGLAGSGVSLEPINLPGHYVRHYSFGFRVSKYECKRVFREDATFFLR